MRKLFFAIAILSCFCFADCKKSKNTPPPDNPYGLPNATQEGKNIFACRVNGENWISEKGIYNIGSRVSNDTLSCWGKLKDVGYIDNLSIYVFEEAAQGRQYVLGGSISGYIRNDLNQTCTGYHGGNIHSLFSSSGNVTITKLDRTNRIVSGTFNCTIPVPGCDTLEITDGRFDIRYH